MFLRAIVPDFQQNAFIAYIRPLIISTERNGLNSGRLQVDFVMWGSLEVQGAVPSIDLDFPEEEGLSVIFPVWNSYGETIYDCPKDGAFSIQFSSFSAF